MSIAYGSKPEIRLEDVPSYSDHECSKLINPEIRIVSRNLTVDTFNQDGVDNWLGTRNMIEFVVNLNWHSFVNVNLMLTLKIISWPHTHFSIYSNRVHSSPIVSNSVFSLMFACSKVEFQIVLLRFPLYKPDVKIDQNWRQSVLCRQLQSFTLKLNSIDDIHSIIVISI